MKEREKNEERRNATKEKLVKTTRNFLNRHTGEAEQKRERTRIASTF